MANNKRNGEHTLKIAVDDQELNKARETAIELSKDYAPDITSLMYSTNLDEVESGIKRLNDMSEKCWLLSGIALYSLIYNKNMYQQSGLGWSEYLQKSEERLGVGYKEIYEQLSASRFFICHYEKLLKKGWTPNGSKMKLVYGELAVEMSGSLDKTIDHICKDSFKEYREWYSSFRQVKYVKEVDTNYDIKPKDIKVTGRGFFMSNIEAVKVSKELPKAEQDKLNGYLRKIFDALKEGVEPQITIPKK